MTGWVYLVLSKQKPGDLQGGSLSLQRVSLDVAQLTPLAMIACVQQPAPPPGWLLHPLPPQVPHEASQQTLSVGFNKPARQNSPPLHFSSMATSFAGEHWGSGGSVGDISGDEEGSGGGDSHGGGDGGNALSGV